MGRQNASSSHPGWLTVRKYCGDLAAATCSSAARQRQQGKHLNARWGNYSHTARVTRACAQRSNIQQHPYSTIASSQYGHQSYRASVGQITSGS